MRIREEFLSERFYDDVKYPYGFSKSGVFTIAEAEFLESKGAYLKALGSGEIKDVTAEEKHIIDVILGKSEAQSFGPGAAAMAGGQSPHPAGPGFRQAARWHLA